MRATTPAEALAVTLADELHRCGVTDAVLAPGSRSAPLAFALHGQLGIRLHVQIDERSAAFTALGLAKASGRPAVVLSTSGTAAANFLPAVAEAWESRTPLLVLTADRPPELRHTAANQTIDQVKLYGDCVRWFVDVGVPDGQGEPAAYWRSLAARAYHSAVGPPAGPVHANVAFREPLAPRDGEVFPHPLDGRADGGPWAAVTNGPHAPSRDDIEALAAVIAEADRGVLVAGDTTADPEPLVRLAAAAGWPLLAEPLSGARHGPNAISAYHALLSAPVFAEAHVPEVVIRVGKPGLSRALLGWLRPGIPEGLIDGDGAWLDPARSIRRLVAADPALTCAAIADRLAGREPTPWLQAWRDAEAVARRTIDELLDADEAPTEPRTARDVAAAVPDGGVLVAASSMPVRDLDLTMAPRSGLRVLGNRGASGIDGFVSTALGVALAEQAPVVALAGDLSVLHDQNGFLLADRSGIDLCFVVVNNDGGGIFSLLPHAEHEGFERLFGTPHGIDLARLAELYGVTHQLVDRAADVPAAVAAGIAAGGLRLVEVRTERAVNAALHHRLLEAVEQALQSGIPST